MNRWSRDVFREILRNVWEIPVFGGSENLLLNNITHLHFVHISSFLARNWHFGIQRELVFWIFYIFWFCAIFGSFWAKKCQFTDFLPNFAQNPRLKDLFPIPFFDPLMKNFWITNQFLGWVSDQKLVRSNQTVNK